MAQGGEWWFLAFRLQEAELQNCLSQQVQWGAAAELLTTLKMMLLDPFEST